MADMLAQQEAPGTWSWTGHFAQFLSLQTTRSIHCAFNAAKLIGVRGFWLRSTTLCTLTIAIDLATADCTMSVFLKGQLQWRCSLTAAAGQCSLLTPEQTQQGWVLAVAAASSNQDLVSKCCFAFDGNAQSCGEVLQHVREQRLAFLRQQQPAPAHTAGAGPSDSSERPHVPECDRAPVDGTAARRSLPPAEAAWPVSGTQRQTSTLQPAAGPGQAPVTALAHHLRDDTLASAIKECMADSAFRRLVDRVEALWDDLGLPDEVT